MLTDSYLYENFFPTIPIVGRFFATDVVVVDGPVITKLLKSKRICWNFTIWYILNNDSDKNLLFNTYSTYIIIGFTNCCWTRPITSPSNYKIGTIFRTCRSTTNCDWKWVRNCIFKFFEFLLRISKLTFIKKTVLTSTTDSKSWSTWTFIITSLIWTFFPEKYKFIMKV